MNVYNNAYIKMNKPDASTTPPFDGIDSGILLDEIRQRITTAKREAALATQSTTFSPIDEAGQRIRAERHKQGLTLHDLCELSGVAYATLNKIERGHPSARLDSIGNVAHALGLKLWIG